MTTRAIEFIKQNAKQPFFLYLPLNIPHSPMQVPDRYWSRFQDKEIQPDPVQRNAERQDLIHTRAALAMCENIDDNVGRLIEYLETSRLSDNTIIVYFSDNGPNGFRYNGGMRGRKGSTYEGGLRSPCFVRYPKKIRAGLEVRQIAAAVDLLPTLVELAGFEPDLPKPLDGESLAGLLIGDQQTASERLIFSTWKQKASVRNQRWRMQRNGDLYDIEKDPRESTNVAADNPAVVKSMKQQLQRYLRDIDGTSGAGPFTVGHRKANYTQLPARDAIPAGGVERNNRFPQLFLPNQLDFDW